MSEEGITGGDEISSFLGGARARILAAAAAQLGIEAELILSEAVALVPIEEGTLQNSGQTAQDGLEAAIGFGAGPAAPYAVRQHEDLTYTHDSGRQAKYLEVPFVAAAGRTSEAIARAIQEAS